MTLPYTRISQLTGRRYSEFKYSSTGETMTCEWLPVICRMLSKCGFDITEREEYDSELENAVRAFQRKYCTDYSGGVLDNTTLHVLIIYANEMNDVVESDDDTESSESEEESTSPHYGTFFNKDNYKLFRKNNQDIKISFGSGAITKTIKDVYIRSSTVEVDTSGNPISEIYEFIARDLKESDELNDKYKYTTSDDGSSPSDIKYIFNYNS